jgi:hypothetical protein
MQRKVGVGTAVAGSASAGQVLTISAAGTSTWSTPTPGGLVQIVPTSVAVGSGSGSVDANGAITFTSASSVSINGCFTSAYDNYKVVAYFTTLTGGLTFRLRASGSDNSTSNYYSSALQNNWNADALVVAAGRQSAANIINMYFSGPVYTFDLYSPNANVPTEMYSSFARNGTTNWSMQGALHNANYQADGFTFAATSTTGTIRIYGYKN